MHIFTVQSGHYLIRETTLSHHSANVKLNAYVYVIELVPLVR